MPPPARPPRLDALPPPLLRPINVARRVARKERIALYLVGGAVRDLLLGRPVTDVDLAVESGARHFAREVARALGAAVKEHGRFGTATIELSGGGRLDVATARREDYDRPGALPRVRAGTIEQDLARRDFTVNAMALEIARTRPPRLFDPFGGRKDVRQGVVRMLHPRSPFDDPTRAFRAVRYANRLGFRIERATREWIRRAIAASALDVISGDRLRREVALVFAEQNRAAAAREMTALGLARAIQPALAFDAAVGRRLRTAERLAAAPGGRASWLAYLLVWMGDPSEEDARAIARRLNLPRAAAKLVLSWPKLRRSLLGAGGASVAELVTRIDGLSDDCVVALAAVLPPAIRQSILEARRLAPGFQLRIRGRDLLEAGVPPGPAIGRALSATLSARRHGAIRPDEELEFALRAARS